MGLLDLLIPTTLIVSYIAFVLIIIFIIVGLVYHSKIKNFSKSESFRRVKRRMNKF